MLGALRRAAGQLLAGSVQQQAAALVHPPPAAAAALQQMRWRRSSAAGSSAADVEAQDIQPFSVALKQLEAAMVDDRLPPDVLAANRSALGVLREFAHGLEHPPPGRAYPPAAIKTLSFGFRDPFQQDEVQRVRWPLKTTGGNCAQLVQSQLGELLQRMGLNPHFFFDGDQFRPRPPPRVPAAPRPRPAPAPAPAAAAKRTAAEVEAVRAKAAAAGFPSQTVSQEEFEALSDQSAEGRAARKALQEEVEAATQKMQRIDPLLAAVAAVPWLESTREKESQDKAQLIRSKVLDEVESWGWDVRGAVHRIWAGERSVAELTKDKDAGSQLAIKSVLFHAKANDAKYGGKRVWLSMPQREQ